ncbi:MAG: C10 family peptidase [Prevotella sp.]|nr:C10 family peptidase [Prevotella sp.]MBP3839330.1 C10 family peptidase [Prevotella sp.]
MKKIFTLLVALLSTCYIGVFGTPIDQNQALKMASDFFAANGHKKSKSPLKIGMRSTQNSTTPSDAQLLYVINRGENDGYAIVAGDDCVTPILAFSDKGHLDISLENLSKNTSLRWMLEEFERQILWAKENMPNTLAKKSMHKAEAYNVLISPLLEVGNDRRTRRAQTISWGQDWPFNTYCPTLADRYGTVKKTVTGCVATAIATVMRWHEWPVRPKGSLSYIWRDGGYKQMSLNFDGTGPENAFYNWSQMPEAVTSYGYDRATNARVTATQEDNLGRLLRDVGYAVQMGYNLAENGGSYTYLDVAVRPLVNNFSYSNSMTHLERANYDKSSWLTIIQNELENYGPIVYAGISYEGGHCFVIDGFATNNYVHVDWGWNQMENGWYLIDILEPGSEGIGGGGGGYSSDQQMLRFVRPNRGGDEEPLPVSGKDIYVYQETIVKAAKANNQVISIDLGNSNQAYDYTGKFVLAIQSFNGTSTTIPIVATLDDQTIKSREHRKLDFNADLSKESHGQYYLIAAYYDEETRSYNAIPGTAGELTITSGETPQTKEYKLNIPAKATLTAKAGETTTLNIDVNNGGTGEYSGKLQLYTGYGVYSGKLIAEQDCQIEAGATRSVAFTTNETFKTLTAGKHELFVRHVNSKGTEDYIYLGSSSYNYITGELTITAGDTPQTKEYKLNVAKKIDITAKEGVDNSFDIMLKNTGDGKFNGMVKVYATTGYSIYSGKIIAERVCQLAAGETQNVTFNTTSDYTQLASGTYRIFVRYVEDDQEKAMYQEENTYNEVVGMLTISSETTGMQDQWLDKDAKHGHNLNGQRVGGNYKGVVVIDGKKVIRK